MARHTRQPQQLTAGMAALQREWQIGKGASVQLGSQGSRQQPGLGGAGVSAHTGMKLLQPAGIQKTQGSSPGEGVAGRVGKQEHSVRTQSRHHAGCRAQLV
jgi:hypothetical protein